MLMVRIRDILLGAGIVTCMVGVMLGPWRLTPRAGLLAGKSSSFWSLSATSGFYWPWDLVCFGLGAALVVAAAVVARWIE